MANSMTFPATFEEFAEAYKIVDSKEVYTNGTELIPIFRVKQWLEHKSAEVKHGHWGSPVLIEGLWSIPCSKCLYSTTIRDKNFRPFFCSNCGAEMDGSDTND